MNEWNAANVEPPKNRPIIAYCPDWCDMGYQACKWNGKEFYYDEQPNDMFHENVAAWALFMEVE